MDASTGGLDGGAAMAVVLRRRRLDREVIEILLTHEPKSMANLVVVLGEWRGREEEHLALLRTKYGGAPAAAGPGAGPAAAPYTLLGRDGADHCALAADAIYSVDATLRAAANRILFTRASPHADTVAHIEALHLLNVIRQGAAFLQQRFPVTEG